MLRASSKAGRGRPKGRKRAKGRKRTEAHQTSGNLDWQRGRRPEGLIAALSNINLPQDILSFVLDCFKNGQNSTIGDVIRDALQEKRRAMIMKTIAEMIPMYNWIQAFEDRTLIDVTPLAKAAGFGIPVALTPAAYERLEPSKKGRLRKIISQIGEDQALTIQPVPFDVVLMEDGEQHTVHLKLHVGIEVYLGESVVAIMLEHESPPLVRPLR